MTKILISVTDLHEAQLALNCGAGMIDLKDPSKGALGALPLDTITEIAAFVREKYSAADMPVSATIGDLPMHPALLTAQVSALHETGVDIVKVGFFAQTDAADVDYQLCLKAFVPLVQSGVQLIAVLFAEYQYPQDLVAAIANAGFIGVMVDTAEKNGATFLDYFSVDQMREIAAHAHANGLLFGLAGSLSLQHVQNVKQIAADYIGFRGGVCADNVRHSRIDADKIIAIRNAI